MWDFKTQWQTELELLLWILSTCYFKQRVEGSMRKTRCGLQELVSEYMLSVLVLLKESTDWDKRRYTSLQLAKPGPWDNDPRFPKPLLLLGMQFSPLPEVAIPTAMSSVLVGSFPNLHVGHKESLRSLVFLGSLRRRVTSGLPHIKFLSLTP